MPTGKEGGGEGRRGGNEARELRGIERHKLRYYFPLRAGSAGFMTAGLIRCRLSECRIHFPFADKVFKILAIIIFLLPYSFFLSSSSLWKIRFIHLHELKNDMIYY